MKLIYKLFRLDPDSREDVITVTSGLGIAVNLLIAAIKVVIGLLASSIAIISEGVNNAADAFSSVLALVGTKLSGKRPDEKHPFGYGRVEYLTSLVIAVLILISGFEVLTGAVKRVFEPEALSISYITLAIIAVSALIKYFLGIYTIKMGKKAESGALVGVGLECRNDSIVSVITIVSSLLFLIFGWNIDAYAGIITALIILKAGFDVLKDTVSELLGRPGKQELAGELYREIRGTEGILNAADLMLHNYGPDAYSGSVNVEIDHNKTVGEIYGFLHELQLRILREYGVVLVFGIYAVDHDRPELNALRRTIGEFIRTHEHVKSFHALYLQPETDRVYLDFVVDYALRDWDSLKNEFLAYMAEKYPEKEIVLTVETEYV